VGHAGGKAIYDFIVELKNRGFKICLASLAWPEESRHFDDLRSLCDDTCLLVSVPVFTDTLFNSFQSEPLLFLPRVLKGILKHFRIRRNLNEGIRQMIRRHQPDLVQVEYTIMALYLARLNSQSTVLHLHDLMLKPYARLWKAERNISARFLRFVFFLILKNVEIGFCRTFDKVLVKSEYDRKLLLQYRHFNAQVFPLGVHPQKEIEPYTSREPKSILFVGAMFRQVNERAALYCIERVLPKLQRRIGPVKFYVVGCGPSTLLKEKSSENVVVTGFVEDLSPFYGHCHAFIAPLFVGGGMIFKIVQAMSFGLPVVSSSVGNEGIGALDGAEILIAEDPDEFSEKLASLMTDQELWQRISAGGQKLVNEKYSWDVVMREYLSNIAR